MAGEDLKRRAQQRLYEVSKDYYAPALAAFAARWLDELAAQPGSVALCLGRDGLAPFLAARRLLQAHPRRFPGLHPRRVRLAYVSRTLAQRAAANAGQADLLKRYLQHHGLSDAGPLLLVDVGVHGSIQDCLQRIYPQRPIDGRYLVLRRRAGDPFGGRKRGFLADLDVAPPCALAIDAGTPRAPGWEVGGALRAGNALFLRPRSVHVLEDLWNGVGGTAVGLQPLPNDRVVAVRSRACPTLTLPPQPQLSPAHWQSLKRAALHGVVDGVSGLSRLPQPELEASRALGSWFEALDTPIQVDAFIMGSLVRQRHARHGSDYFET